MDASGHTHNFRKCRHVSVGLAQARPNDRVLRWHGRHSAKVTKNANLGYSHDRGLS